MSGRAAAAKSMYARHFREKVKFARASGAGAAANIAWDQTRFLRAHVSGFTAAESSGGLIQGEQEVMILAADLDAATSDAPPRAGDRILMPSGNIAIVQSCDANTRRIAGETIAYVCRVMGQ